MVAISKTVKAKVILNTRIKFEVMHQIQYYCHWAGIDDINLFIEKASRQFLEEQQKNAPQCSNK